MDQFVRNSNDDLNLYKLGYNLDFQGQSSCPQLNSQTACVISTNRATPLNSQFSTIYVEIDREEEEDCNTRVLVLQSDEKNV